MKASNFFSFRFTVTPFNVVAAVFLTAFAVNHAHYYITPDSSMVQVEHHRTVKLNSEVTKESMDLMITKVKEMMSDSDAGIVIHLNTPGGSVLDGRELELVLTRSINHVITYVDNMAASMGFDIFIRGNERVIHTNGLLMTHRGSIGGVPYGTVLAKMKELDAKSKAGTLSVMEKAELVEMHSIIDIMDKLFQSSFDRLYELKKTAPNPEAMQKIIDALKVGDADIWLNAQEAIDAGIATSISDKMPTVKG